MSYQWSNGQLVGISVAKDAASAAQPLISNIQWEPFGGVRSWQMQLTSGTKLQERVFDEFGRLVRYPLGAVVRDMTYDAADRIVSYTHLDATTGQSTAVAQAMNQSFGYDELGRLTSVITPSNSWAITYDANGNRTSVTQNGVARTYTTPATSNRLTSVSNPSRNLGYDAAGNTLTDTGSAYTTTYRLDNRMGTLTKGGVTLTYRYDAGGQRVHKEHSQGMRYFAYDLDGKMLGEYNATSQVHEFVWLGDTPVAVMTGSGPEPSILYVYADHLNAPRILIDKADALRWRWMSEPFGTATPEQAPAGLAQVVFNLRFPGQFFDSESGLYYNYFRDYDATLGRYVQSDPIGLAGGLNTFSYVGAAPVSSWDSLGLAGTRFGKNHSHCKALRRKVDNLQEEYDDRWEELVGGLPERIGPGEALSATMRGHRTLINRADSRWRYWQKRYDDECDDDDNSSSGAKTAVCPPEQAAGSSSRSSVPAASVDEPAEFSSPNPLAPPPRYDPRLDRLVPGDPPKSPWLPLPGRRVMPR